MEYIPITGRESTRRAGAARTPGFSTSGVRKR